MFIKSIYNSGNYSSIVQLSIQDLSQLEQKNPEIINKLINNILNQCRIAHKDFEQNIVYQENSSNFPESELKQEKRQLFSERKSPNYSITKGLEVQDDEEVNSELRGEVIFE